MATFARGSNYSNFFSGFHFSIRISCPVKDREDFFWLCTTLKLIEYFPSPCGRELKGGLHRNPSSPPPSPIKGETEPSALDATWDSESVFKIGVVDNGTNRGSNANYACGVLYNEGFRGKGVEVTIIDIEKLADKKRWGTLRKASCEENR